jgi:DNA-binding response OmpR family regulator
MTQTILVVEDDRAIRQGLERAILKEGFDALAASSAEEALDLMVEHPVDLLILDLMLPGQSGLQVCKTLRARGMNLPILMLTALADESDKILGLDVGADDYITKPFSLDELMARVRANLRRFVPQDSTLSEARFGDVHVDFRRFVASKGGREIHLPAKAFGLLHALVGSRGDVITRDQLLSEVWGYDAMLSTRTVDNHISLLRSRVEDDSRQPRHILTVHGVGYRFVDETNP